MALIRLAYKRGLLQGELSDVQELALLTMMAQENEDEVALEEARFRSQIIAAHPDKAKQILEALDAHEEEDLADEMTDEDMENYEPLSTEETQAAIDALRKFGLAVQ